MFSIARTSDSPDRVRRLAGRLHGLMVEALRHMVLIALLSLALMPFIVMVISSFKSHDSIVRSLWSLPVQEQDRAAGTNYQRAWVAVSPFIGNSVIVTGCTALGVLAAAVMSSYAFTRMRFAGATAAYSIVLGLLMVPGILTLIPSFLWVRALFWNQDWNLIGTYWVLIIPAIAGGQVIGIFLCRSFFAALPAELFEAAKIDGAGDLYIIWHIVLPLSRPILATVVITNVLSTWNDFMWPMLTAGDERMFTLAIGLRFFMGQNANDYGALFAGYTIAALPLLIVFSVSMRFFMSGLMSGAVKA